MRRQTKPHGLAARWPLRPLDVDPFHLPARYALPVRSAAGGQAEEQDSIFITREQVAVERCREGRPVQRQTLAVAAFAGVAVRIARLAGATPTFAISVNLHHEEPDLCLPLHMANDLCDAGARWLSWGRMLKLPLLLPTPDGDWREAKGAPGRLTLGPPAPRSPRLALAGRRSRMSAVREVGSMTNLVRIEGIEIIART